MSATSHSSLQAAARILIVEDEIIIAQDTRFILQDLGYSVIGIASSASEAFHLMENDACDLALTDIQIRGSLDGIQTAHQLKQRHNIPIVYMTAHTDDDTLERARATGPFGYVSKPVTATALKIAVSVALERYRLTRQLEERESAFCAALSGTGDAILISAADGSLSFLNSAAEKLIGLSSHQAQGKQVSEVLRFGDDCLPAQVSESVADSFPQVQPRFLARTLRRPDQAIRQVLLSSVSLEDAAPGGVVTIIRDTTALRKTEYELRHSNTLLTRANRELTLLANSLMHDLREPLNSVGLYSELLAADQKGPLQESSQAYLRGISESCERMHSLMTSLREYSSAVIHGRDSAESLNASVSFREALLNLHAAITASNAQIQSSNLPPVYVHPVALVLIFQNLIANAIKFAGSRIPHIRVSAVRCDSLWQFTVADRGIGFEPDQADRIFGLFKRGHGNHISGSGIGLAICRQLVEQHEGRIWAESKPGEGARFHFTLPAVTALRKSVRAASAS